MEASTRRLIPRTPTARPRGHSRRIDEDSSVTLMKCTTPAGVEMTTWKWLRAMIEHEIHHRGQMFTYLRILGVDPGALFGLTSEQVAERGVE